MLLCRLHTPRVMLRFVKGFAKEHMTLLRAVNMIVDTVFEDIPAGVTDAVVGVCVGVDEVQYLALSPCTLIAQVLTAHRTRSQLC